MDDYISDFGPKVLVVTYTSTDFVGRYLRHFTFIQFDRSGPSSDPVALLELLGS